MPQQTHPDVFVIGGGPAGLAAAICASDRGFRVAVADHECPPIDKACGEGLMPGAVQALASMGISFAANEAVAFRGIRFLDHTTKLVSEAAFPDVTGLAVRRTTLHAILARRAAESGVSLLWGARVTRLGYGEFACEGRKVQSRWIVGADGEHSRVRRLVAPDSPRRERVRFGRRQHFRIVPWSDFVEVYWGRTCQIVVTPSGSQEVGVAVTSRDSHMNLASALQELPQLAERISGATPVSRERGAPCALRVLQRVQRGHFALIGDASGSVDPLTGEGLGLAFRQAAALADAFSNDNLTEYQAAHDRISKISCLMSRLLLLMDRNEWFRHRVLRAFAAEPRLFSRVLDAHIEALSPAAFGIANAVRLGWRLVSSAGAEV